MFFLVFFRERDPTIMRRRREIRKKIHQQVSNNEAKAWKIDRNGFDFQPADEDERQHGLFSPKVKARPVQDRRRSFLQEVGVILTQPQRVFHRLMDVGDSRMQWDTTFSRLSILDRVDKFTDTIELASGGKVFYRNNPSAQKASH